MTRLSTRVLVCLAALSIAPLAAASSPAGTTPPGANPDTPQAPGNEPGSPPAPATAPTGETGAKPPAERPVTMADLPPFLRLGARVGTVSGKLPVARVVVIATDPQTYIDAIAGWSVRVRYPVLYDDGSWASAQRIARFVRAFDTAEVYICSAGDKDEWPEEVSARRALLQGAVASAWRTSEQEKVGPDELFAHWKKLQFVPPGVVLADVKDGAWTGALALAAGRGQPLVWAEFPKHVRGDLNGSVTGPEVKAIEDALQDVLKGMPWSYDKVGDDIDAITICLNGPIKVFPGGADASLAVALTDTIGRGFGEDGQPNKERWAWAGQILGNESQAAYMAMSALFLPCESAWLFDGYDPGEPWAQYDATAAAAYLEKAHISSSVDDTGDNGAMTWRLRAAGVAKSPAPEEANAKVARGIDAGFIAVNTSGHPEFFELKPEVAYSADLPFLRRPAAVYFVHSWSSSSIGSPGTIAGRWLERGAYAFIGSVHEPFLQGFVNTPSVTARLASGGTWGSAGRIEGNLPWKIATIGDPLMRLRNDLTDWANPLAPPSPNGCRKAGDILAEKVKAREFEESFRLLAMLGRDEQGARLAGALLKDDPEAFSPAAAVQALPSVYFAGDSGTFQRTFLKALPLIRSDARYASLLDMPWHVYTPVLSTLTADEASLLNQSVRAAPVQLRERDMKESSQASSRSRERGR